MKPMEYKGCTTEVKEVTDKGIVTFYAAVFGNEDLGGDVIERGAFKKTLSENSKNFRHFKDHNPNLMPGVIQSIKEDDYGLLTTSKLILSTQLGKETYEQYKALAEAGKSVEHSIGFNTIKHEEKQDLRILKELRLFEVSSLTAWGMNPKALTESVKSLENIDFNYLITEQKYFQRLLNCKFTDAKLEQLETLKKYIDSLVASRLESTQQKPTIVKGSEIIKTLNFKF